MPYGWNGANVGTRPWRGERWDEDRIPTWYDDDADRYGRHALDEDALFTPIFYALSRARRRTERHERARAHDEWEAFRRDPLTAPIPMHAYQPSPVDSHGWCRPPAPPSRPRRGPGRHRYRAPDRTAY